MEKPFKITKHLMLCDDLEKEHEFNNKLNNEENHQQLLLDIARELAENIENQKYQIILDRLKKLNIEYNPEIEKERRFKSLTSEQKNGEEIYYYNDGSVNGLLVVRFKVNHNKESENPINCFNSRVELVWNY
jgi:N-acetylmuramoyl-L-alanine amidase